jgi:hypothetical protein
MAEQYRKFFSYQSYLYVICFITVVISIVWATIGMYSVVKVIAPVYTFSEHDTKDYYDFSNFQAHNKQWIGGGDDGAGPAKYTLKTKDDWESYKKIMIAARRHDGINNIILSIIGLIVSLPVLIFHWKKAQVSRDKSE